ncbi:MAG: hypothetical protein HOP33_09050 [Verrucomicrobia bacterium]|nr:hypothetical protein [Verrucomicrobiota bacterium]
MKRESRKVIISTKLQDALNQLQSIADSHHFSQRKFAAKTGISAATFRRLKQGAASAEVWLPKLQSAAARLQTG